MVKIPTRLLTTETMIMDKALEMPVESHIKSFSSIKLFTHSEQRTTHNLELSEANFISHFR